MTGGARCLDRVGVRRERNHQRLGDLVSGQVDQDRLDDRTWQDLGGVAVFDQVDRTLTAPGEQILYAHLRCPVLTPDALTERCRLQQALAGASSETTGELRRVLSDLGGKDGEFLAELLWREDPRPKLTGWHYRLGPLAVLASLAVALAGAPAVGLVWLFFAFVVNVGLHNRARRLSEGDLQSLRYLGRLLRAGRRLLPLLGAPGLSTEQNSVRAAINGSRWLRLRLGVQSLLGQGLVDDLFGTFNVLLLTEARTYLRVWREILRLRTELRGLFVAVGRLDVAQSVLALRAEAPWCQVELDQGPPRLEVVDLVHPLLDSGVPNSLLVERGGLVITGSNMSGKSTFLRALGLGVVLAQGIGVVPARRYRARFFVVRSVMAAADDLAARKSYYLDEALAVLRLMEQTALAQPRLCLIDEPFRGTNSAERIAAGVSVARHLVGQDHVVMLATHDLQLAALLGDLVQAAHFDDEALPGGLRFDHRLRPGLATRTNALDVLAQVGYPATVVAESRRLTAQLRAGGQ